MEKTTQKTGFLRKFIGDKAFYKMVLAVAVPIMIQNGITNFVSLLDNIMIGQVGTEQMSGVAIVNQILFVYSLCLFGGVSGAGIFTAQYYGQKNHKGVQDTMRFKLYLVVVITILTVLLLLGKGDALILAYLKGEGTAASAAATLASGREYMWVMLLGLPAFALCQVYSSTLRECGETILPMKAGMAAVFVNLVFNYLLIYGKFGFPELGVAGAGIATALSRYVELGIVMVKVHRSHQQYPFFRGLYRSFRIPAPLVKNILVKGTPLLLNETLWAAGIAMLAQCYSIRSLNVVAALNISNTIGNLFNIVFIALGDSVAIVVGQLLGAGKMKEARETDTKMIAFSVACCTGIALIMFACAPLFPMLYNTDADTRRLATTLIMATAVFLPQNAFLHAAYFTLRSGGKTIITFLFDSAFIWVVSIPVAALLSYFTMFPVLTIYIAVQLADSIKCIVGFVLVKKGVWLNNIVS